MRLSSGIAGLGAPAINVRRRGAARHQPDRDPGHRRDGCARGPGQSASIKGSGGTSRPSGRECQSERDAARVGEGCAIKTAASAWILGKRDGQV